MSQLSSMAEDLRRETTDLTGKEADLLDQIERGRRENKTSTKEAKHWLAAVKKVRSDAEEFDIDFQRREGFSLQSPYQLVRRAELILKDVRRLTAEIRDLPVFAQDPVVYWPESFPAIGLENILSKICGLIEDEDFRIIGIYGMGGVGKTTLLKRINNNFYDKSSGRFDLVIRIERIDSSSEIVSNNVRIERIDSSSEIVSNNVRIDRIQEEIGTWLGYSRPGGDLGPELPRDPDSRKRKLCTSLIQKQFLLLLDDLWESLDLDEIGIPVSRKGSKIVFTTRLRRVCQDMEADQVEVPCLDPPSSWKLFCRSLGNTEDQLSASTRSLAQSVAEKCGGLPLALVTVGHAMAGARNDCEWDMALETLRGGAAEVDGIEKVRNILKFSFDRYKDEGHKECLLYCSLFPQGPTVYIDDLIEYWIGEGFLETLNCPIRTARNRCQRAFTDLKAACLLDEGHETDISKTFVKLHDMVREMALWISHKDCKADEKTIFALDPSQMPECAEMSEKWTKATRISLMSSRIRELPEWPDWFSLRTLLLRGSSNLEQIPSGVFMSVPLLTVLDLSRTNINRLPPEIRFLVELRYLNLKGTPLELLPKEVGKLTNLRILNLDELNKLKEIPKEAISSLSSLQSLTMHYGSYIWRGGWKDNGGEYEARDVCLKDLDGLEKLEELQLEIIVNSNEDLHGLSDCRRLCSVIRSLRLVHLEGFLSSDLFDILETTKDLRMLNIKSCLPCKTSFTLDLRNLLIFPADHLTKLETLQLWDVPVESIAGMDSSVFGKKAVKGAKFQNFQDLKIPSLREITLINMKNFKSICGKPLLFPNLKVVQIEKCPKLEKLPFELNGATCLETLFVKECTKMVNILEVKESQLTKVHAQKNSFFCSLKVIILENMQNLKSICGQPFLFSSLKKVHVENCPELQKLPLELNSVSCLETIVLKECNKMVEILAVEESEVTNMHAQKDSIFSSLKTIRLENMQNLKRICGQPLLFPGLKDVHLENCAKLEMLPFELNSAICLETLVLKGCAKIVEILVVNESELTNVDAQKHSFSCSLIVIILENMENLKNICGQPLLFPRLNTLDVKNCPKLEKLPFELNSVTCLKTLVLMECTKMVEILAVEESELTKVRPQKHSFFCSLEIIILGDMKNLKSICGQPLFLPSLKNAMVDNCPELEKLPFELNSATCLETFVLKECSKMVEILAIEELDVANVHGQKNSIFSSLTTITLGNMKNLKSIGRHPMLFPSLKNVRVKNCPKLEKLPLELNNAICLETLFMKDCTKMVELFVVEEREVTNVHRQKDSIVSSLKTIRLENMQNLKRICGQLLLFPDLKDVHMENCPKLEKLPFEVNSATCLETLVLKECAKMVEILAVNESELTNVNAQKHSFSCSLIVMILENMENLKSICGQPLLFPRLNLLDVKNCPKLEKLPFELNSATCLKTLVLIKCTKMVEILAVEESELTKVRGQKHSFFCSLKIIILGDMKNLKSICGQPLFLPSLKNAMVDNCPELEKLPFELNSATCLETFVLKECYKMVEILAIEESDVTNVHRQKDSIFSSLTTITLDNMKNLKSIGGHPMLFPSLKNVRVKNCPKLEKLPLELNNAICLETLFMKDCTKMVELFAVEESEVTNVHRQKDSIVSSLKTIRLENMQNLKRICGQPLLFPDLKDVHMENCRKLEILPFEVNSAICLETLFMKDCTKMVELFAVEEIEVTNVHRQKDSIVSSLKTIRLENMQNLKRIYGQPFLFPDLKDVHMENCPKLEMLPFELNSATCLETLVLKECAKMVKILAVEESELTNVDAQKHSFSCSLIVIHLENMENLKSICGQPLLFPRLNTLDVKNCPKLEKLPFELNSATCLKTLVLMECTKMVEILAVEESELTKVRPQKHSFFCSLEIIILGDMKNLKSICGQPLFLPSLKNAMVDNCPELEKLPFELNSATCLETFVLKECSKMVEILAIEESEVTHVHRQKDSIFSSLTTITLDNMKNLKSIGGHPMLFPSLKNVRVKNCPKLEKLPLELNNAICLETLFMNDCTKMVEILAVEESEVTNVYRLKDSIVSSLKTIRLENMQNLKRICGQLLLFPDLKDVHMENCPKLEMLPFEVNSATCLETLVLKECAKMVEILAVEESELTNVDAQKHSFSCSLIVIILENMQTLKSICGQPLLFPRLNLLDVKNCPKLEKLPFELNSATCLKTLVLIKCTKMVEILAVEESELTKVRAQKHSFFCSLEIIILGDMKNLKSICGQPLFLPSLKNAMVDNCPELEKLPFALNSATCLETFVLKECSKMVEIQAIEESDVTNVHRQKDSIFSSLMTITLDNMKNLKSIGGHPMLFPSLKNVRVKNCPKLEKLPLELNNAICLETLFMNDCTKMVEIFAVKELEVTNVHRQKDSIVSSLKTIRLENMQNLKRICGQLLLFPDLKDVHMENCPKLEMLPFEVNSATCLETLVLKECTKMVEILAVEESELTNVDAKKHSFSCSLIVMILENMENLKSICGQPLLFPRLNTLYVKNCPELEKLPFKLNSAPCLKSLVLMECTKMIDILAVGESELTKVRGQKHSIFL